MLKPAGTLFLTLALVASCNSGPGDSDPDPDPGPDAFVDPLSPPERGVQITSGPVVIPAGTELTVCVFFDLPTEAEIPVVKFEQTNSGFVHHFILFKAGSEFEPGTDECPGTLFVTHPPVYPGTRDQGAFDMPEGIALPIAARQGMILQMHLLNATDAEVVEELRMNLHSGDPALEYTRAGVLGASDFLFSIPPHSKHTETQRCRIIGGIELFALTSHSHARTESFDVLADLEGGETSIYHSESWSEPDVAHYEPVLSMGALSYLEFSCTWFNESDEAVGYGGSAEDEMCMMFGYYYPATLDLTPCVGF